VSDPKRDATDFAELVELPPEDPRLRALDAATRARLHAYREFMSSAAPAGARMEEAEARLFEALEREIGVSIAASERPARHARMQAPGSRAHADRGSRGWLRTLFAPSRRPVWAAAAMVVVAGGVLLWSGRGPGEAPLMRGPDAVSPERGAMTALDPQRLADGTLRLEWTPVAEAESYSVVFQSPDLTEIARVEGLREPRLDLRSGALPAGLPPGDEVLWRAVALRGADPVAQTGAVAVRLP